MNNFIGKFIAICLLCTTPLAAFAHELWLEPEQFILQPNTDLKADIKVGQQLNGNKYPYIKSETKSLKLFLKKKEIKLTHRDGDYPAIQSPLKNEGLHVLSYESVPEKVNYANFEIFRTFMEEEGLWETWSKQNPTLVNTNIDEIYTRYAKSLIQVGNQTEDDFNTGLTFELIALDNPYKENNKKGISVILLYKNKPHPNSQITIFNKINNSVSTTKVITNKEGKAFVPLENNGLFLISSVHFIKSENKKADWHSLWASLTFAK